MKYMLLLLVFVPAKIFCQATSFDTLNWNAEHLLSWNDFKGEYIEGTSVTGEIFCMMTANFEKANVFEKAKFTVLVYFDRNKSWIDPGSKTEQSLLYFQVTFNIYEVHRRRLRKTLAETKFRGNPANLFHEKYNDEMQALTDEYNQLKKETKFGTDKELLNSWKIKADSELAGLDAFKG